MSQLRYDVVPKRISSRSKAKFPVKVLSAVVKLYTVVGYYIRVNCGPVIKMKEEKAKSERQGSKAQAPNKGKKPAYIAVEKPTILPEVLCGFKRLVRRYTLSARLAPLHSFRQVTTNLTLRGRTSYLNSASTTPLHSFGRGTADARQGTYVSRLAACRPAATLFWPRHATDALCYSLSARLTGRATLLTRYVIACRRPRHATDALCYSLSARRYTLSAFIWQARLAACRRASALQDSF
ncbi:hypothetical protein BHM03_00049566 [Ensete ventricosum]|nr:hypothetical protein BHM03_00049566 [Ensete ventricosum]